MSFLSFLQQVEHTVANAVTGKGGNQNNQKQKQQQQNQKPQNNDIGHQFLSFLASAGKDISNVADTTADFSNKHIAEPIIHQVATSPFIKGIGETHDVTIQSGPNKGQVVKAPTPQATETLVGSIGSGGAANAEENLAGKFGKVLSGKKGEPSPPTPEPPSPNSPTGPNVLDLRKPGEPTPSGPTPPGVQEASDTLAPKPAEDHANLTARLIDQAKTFDSNVAPSDRVKQALTTANNATENTHKFDWLNKLQSTQAVAAKYFGDVGSNLVYKLSQGAKTHADIQESVQPLVQETQTLLNKAAKSSAGRADIQSRISQALEDRPNAAQYLQNDAEKKIFDKTAQVLDFFKQQREARGKGTLENYSPRTQIQDALNAPDRLLKDVQGSFSTNAESAFSKHRVEDAPVENVDTNVVDLLPRYVSSQAKEFGYEEPLQYFKDNISKVNPVHLSNSQNARTGQQYLNTLFTQILNPDVVSKGERAANKALATTYRSSLGFSPRFALQNLTQRFATGSETTGAAKRLAGKFTDEHTTELRSGLTSGENPISSELSSPETGITAKVNKLDPGMKVEAGNIHGAFDRGAAQHIIESQPYKDAIAQGAKKQEAISAAIADPETKELAIRRGNVVANNTQFGANAVTKPEFFRQSGFVAVIPRSFIKQYQRFSAGMTEKLSETWNPKAARELDILKRGDPRQTPLVEYKKAAQSLQGATKDLITGIKRGEVQDIDLGDAQSYAKVLDKAVGTLDKQIKASSQIRGPKTARSFAKMWGAAMAVQYLFNGGNLGNAVTSSAPVNAPQTGRDVPSTVANVVKQAPGLLAPSLPTSAKQVPGKVVNFIPGVGVAYNRAKDVGKFAKTLSGGQ